MKAYIVSTPDIPIVCVAKSYKAAVNYLFGNCWINPKDEIMIDGEMTSLEEYFGEDCVDMIAEKWDEDTWNDFWNQDFWITSYEVAE